MRAAERGCLPDVSQTTQSELHDLAHLATGSHLNDLCYGARRAVKDSASLLLEALGFAEDAA